MNNFTQKLINWDPPTDWNKITTIDSHTAGEPLRIVTSGLPMLKGTTILEIRRYIQQNHDYIRKVLMWEPRGHADMYGCIITPPVTREADFGVIFMHNEGYSTMCGHGIIAVTKVAIETGLIQKKEPKISIKIDTPAGLIKANAILKNGVVEYISFINVPSFVVELDAKIDIDRIGSVKFDLAYGGAYYSYIQAQDLGLTCSVKDLDKLIWFGRKIKKAISESTDIKHPLSKELSYLYGTIFIDRPQDKESHSRNVCIFADGEIDRSPTGTGISGRLAIHHARKELGLGESLIVESIIGSKFSGKILDKIKFGEYNAIIPEVTGTAYITGKHEFYLDVNDGNTKSFMLR
jgi:trans-L-3-hydroxyproline dehydratase